MNNNNVCVFQGVLSRDPEIREVNGKNGPTSVASFSLKVKGSGNRWSFPKCEAWATYADKIGQDYGQGMTIRVSCEHITDSWEDKNTGVKRYADKFRVVKIEDVIEQVESEPEPKQTPPPPQSKSQTRRRTVQAPPVIETEDDEEEIPF